MVKCEVALLVSAWIEIDWFTVNDYGELVALLVSAWIEIELRKVGHVSKRLSHSS